LCPGFEIHRLVVERWGGVVARVAELGVDFT
jgi:hypothetical protein